MTNDDTKDLLDGLSSFIDSVVVPLESKNAELFDHGRNFYEASGAYSTPVKSLLREVRQQAAADGYYTMFAPEGLDGGGAGPALLYEVWRHLYSRYGPARILPFAAVAHWSYGPSVLCDHLTPAARKRMLPQFMSGATTSCFAMS